MYKSVNQQKTVITYGTFDLLHQGHINLLKKAKELGGYLIVGVTSERYDKERGKLNVRKSLMERIEDIQKTGFADKIIIEEYEGQKIEDIKNYKVDIFAIGSDWTGKFDFLNEYCKVIYLERTKGISSTQLRTESQSVIELGIIGSGRIANRFIPESKYVSGVDVKGVYNPKKESARTFFEKHELDFYSSDFQDFISRVDAVYIASPNLSHFEYIHKCLESKKHVLCEKPMVLSGSEATLLYNLAESKGVVLKEAIKTAYCPAFSHLISVLKSGLIGKIKDIDASFSKLITGNTRELEANQLGGSVTELASYTLLPIIKLLGFDYSNIQFFSYFVNDVDLYTKGILHYKNAVASFKVGLGVKTEGELIISGTKGYAYVPAPWWKTEYFEIRYEDTNQTRKYFYKFDGDGLRYEIHDFLCQINHPSMKSHKLLNVESIAIASIIEKFLKKNNIYIIT